MFEEELQLLLEKKWEEEERVMLNKLIDNLMYYKKLLPKSLKKDITDALQMCNLLKLELDKYRELCKCKITCKNNCVDDSQKEDLQNEDSENSQKIEE